MISTPIQAALWPAQTVQVTFQSDSLLFSFDKEEKRSLHLISDRDPRESHFYQGQGKELTIPLDGLAGSYSYQISTAKGQVLKSGSITIPDRKVLPPRSQFSDVHIEEGFLVYQVKQAPQSQAINKARLIVEDQSYPLERRPESVQFQTLLDLVDYDTDQILAATLEVTYEQGQKQIFPVSYQIPFDKIKPQIEVNRNGEELEVLIQRAQALQEPQVLLNGQAHALTQVSPSVYQLQIPVTLHQDVTVQIQDRGQNLYKKTFPKSPASSSIPSITDSSTNTDFPPRFPAPTYPTGQCTWGVKRMIPWVGDWWGNAGQWAQSAQVLGIETGTEPQVGAIACWDDGGYGHVALVTAVSSNQAIQVKEANYLGKSAIQNYRGWFDPTRGWGHLTYIYPPGGH